MNRRAFLGAAAAVATLPATDVGESYPTESNSGTGGVTADGADEPAVRECDVCGADQPASMVDRTTVSEIAPLQADICWSCQFVHEHTPRKGTCAQCGDALDEDYPGNGFPIEIEFPLGAAELPAFKSAKLCGDCAAWIASDINHRGVHNDPVADDRHLRLIQTMDARMHDLEADDA